MRRIRPRVRGCPARRGTRGCRRGCERPRCGRGAAAATERNRSARTSPRAGGTPGREYEMTETAAPLNDRPALAVTVGDPVGIGPEIVVRTLHEVGTTAPARGVVVADPAVLS